MIRLFLNDITGNVIGYEHVLQGQVVYKNDILIEENYGNIFLLKQAVEEHNVYYSNGELISGDVDPFYAAIEEKRAEIKRLSDIVENEHHAIVDSLIKGKSMDEAVADAKENRAKLETAKSELEAAEAQHEQELFKFHANAHAEREHDKKWKYYSSVCLLIRDENRYLKEWIDWHLGIGIDHIYIYDNGVNEKVSVDSDKITVIDWHGEFENVQQDAYNHFLANYGHETRWVNFIDSDEFIRPTSDINEMLRSLEDYTVIYGGFVEYNANGQETYSDKPVRERFTETTDVSRGIYHKDFIQPFRIDRMDRHYPRFSARGNYTLTDTADLFVVDHYYTKSWEEWCAKIARGSSDPKFLKHKNEFFAYNPDMIYLKSDDEIQSYRRN